VHGDARADDRDVVALAQVREPPISNSSSGP
jgi:hypothetical protein